MIPCFCVITRSSQRNQTKQHLRIRVKPPFPPTLCFIQELIDPEHVRRVFLKLHRALARFLLLSTFKSDLCLSKSESVVIQCTPNALLRTTPKAFFIPFRDIAARLVYRRSRGGAMK